MPGTMSRRIFYSSAPGAREWKKPKKPGGTDGRGANEKEEWNVTRGAAAGVVATAVDAA